MPRTFSLILIAALVGAATQPAHTQQFRRIPLDLARGEIDRIFLPASDSFFFVIRASSELRELRGRYGVDSATIDLVAWPRLGGIKSRDATLLVHGLAPGTRYRFEITTIRRPTGNEGRVIEGSIVDALLRTFEAHPTDTLPNVATSAAPEVHAAVLAVLPRGRTIEGSPLSGETDGLMKAFATKGLGLTHESYRQQERTVLALRAELMREAERLARSDPFVNTADDIAARLRKAGKFAELVAPVEACQSLKAPLDSLPLSTDEDHVATLLVLKKYDLALGDCRRLLRDVRLRQYRAVATPGAKAASDLLTPVEHRLGVFRSAVERLMATWRKRESTLSAVAGDLRRRLDTEVTIDSTIVVSFLTEPARERPPKLTLGVGIAGLYLPCSLDSECLRIGPNASLSFRLKRLLSAEIGFTLFKTEAPGRTEHLFWFTSAMTGLSFRLGANRSQRIGAGLVILRKPIGTDLDAFRFGGYFGLTVLDFRI